MPFNDQLLQEGVENPGTDSSAKSPPPPAAGISHAGLNQREPGFPSLFRAANFRFDSINRSFDKHTDRFIPQACAGDPENARRARLICRFGFLGTFFGLIYALFYLSIGHYWGVRIIIVCSAGFGLMPLVMKKFGSLPAAGNMLCMVLTLGFSALCGVEGGASGHAIAWLASVPLCALLLVDIASARKWALASFMACAIIVMLNLTGVAMKPTYDAKWESLVSAAGYLGFILFMFLLGVIFETGRKQALGKMREALADLETSNAELTRLDQEKNEFLGIAAHDLKNPLTVVIGTAELLRICKDENQKERMIGSIIGAGTRMLHLVKNLLDANAIEEGKFISKLECCEVQSLVLDCIQNNQMNANRKGITLRLETDAAICATADRNATIQILDNLISNAVKYSPRNTTVHLRTAVDGGRVQLSIRDEGPGISGEDMKKMFGKFTRLSAAPTGGESSNGLGLSIVKRLAEAMDGNISCQSVFGEGATFILDLPVWNEVATVKEKQALS